MQRPRQAVSPARTSSRNPPARRRKTFFRSACIFRSREGGGMKESPNGAGPLRQLLESAASGAGCSLRALTVLSNQRDPYRLDTPAGHRDGEWFAQQVERFLGGTATVHLRGLHYRVSAAADVRMPNGLPYINTDENSEWLTENAAKAGRWLGYVPFERIVDERNAPPEIYVT